MAIEMTHDIRAESPAQQAAGPRCADESAWREKITHL